MIEILVLALLVASAVNLALMVPGGFVEMRDFSAYSPVVLGALNLFLTLLGLGSLALAWFVFRSLGGHALSAAAGAGYMLVHGLDLGRVFPVSPDPMSRLLAGLEWLGAILGAGLFATGLWAWWTGVGHPSAVPAGIALPALIVGALALVGIVVFATRAAMRRP